MDVVGFVECVVVWVGWIRGWCSCGLGCCWAVADMFPVGVAVAVVVRIVVVVVVSVLGAVVVAMIVGGWLAWEAWW